jgi:hypothetical protein
VELTSSFDFDPGAAVQTRRDFLTRYGDGTLVIGTHWGGAGAGHIIADDDGWRLETVEASAAR